MIGIKRMLSKYLRKCEKCKSDIFLDIEDYGYYDNGPDEYCRCQCGYVYFFLFGKRYPAWETTFKDLHLARITAYNNGEPYI